MNAQPRKLLTLCIIHQGDRVLLGMKKRGFGAGHWNGFGGKVEQGETIEAAAVRELKEEVGITAPDLQEVGVLDFTFDTDPKVLEVHIFSAHRYEGDPVETEEMRPQWFTIDEIPYEQMWSDDRYWLPLLLQGKRFRGAFHFDRPSSPEYSAKILRQDISPL